MEITSDWSAHGAHHTWTASDGQRIGRREHPGISPPLPTPRSRRSCAGAFHFQHGRLQWRKPHLRGAMLEASMRAIFLSVERGATLVTIDAPAFGSFVKRTYHADDCWPSFKIAGRWRREPARERAGRCRVRTA